jgi:hypothetical protein
MVECFPAYRRPWVWPPGPKIRKEIVYYMAQLWLAFHWIINKIHDTTWLGGREVWGTDGGGNLVLISSSDKTNDNA